MKKFITIASMLFVLTSAHSQQHVTKDAKGNYTAAGRDTSGANKPTGHTFTDSKGKIYPVYISARGKLYYIRISKTGNTYKSYIKAN